MDNYTKAIQVLQKFGRVNKQFELFFNLTYKCPLRCTYCYVDYTKAPDMTLDQVKYAIDKLVIEPKKKYIKLVTFFGGEPSLRIDIISSILDYCRDKDIGNTHFAIITSLSANPKKVIELQRKYPMFEIVVSNDVDNSNRLTSTGKVFDINEHIKYSDLYNRNTCFHKTITGNEVLLGDELLHLHKLFKEEKLIYSFSFDKTPKLVNYRPHQISRSFEKYLNVVLLELVQGKINYIPQFFIQYYRRLLKKNNGVIEGGCGINSEYYLNSQGLVSPCSISHHQEDLHIVQEGVFTDTLEYATELELNYFNNPTCKQCDLKGFCPGGCLVYRKQENGDYNVPNKDHCLLMAEFADAFNKVLKTLTEPQRNILDNKVLAILGNFYEYCEDTSTHTDMYHIFEDL